MDVSSDQYRRKAVECEQLANRAHLARIAARYRDLARRWREIAQHAEWLEKSLARADRGPGAQQASGPPLFNP